MGYNSTAMFLKYGTVFAEAGGVCQACGIDAIRGGILCPGRHRPVRHPAWSSTCARRGRKVSAIEFD